jgi:hypothetical protein
MSPPALAQHAPQNAMDDPGEIARFHDCCSDLMRELLGALAAAPDRPRTFPEIERALGWPRRRIASVLGGVAHMRHTQFGGRRPYRFHDARRAPSGRWEMWMDADQAAAVRAAQRREALELIGPHPAFRRARATGRLRNPPPHTVDLEPGSSQGAGGWTRS